jgi:hypothetical protein
MGGNRSYMAGHRSYMAGYGSMAGNAVAEICLMHIGWKDLTGAAILAKKFLQLPVRK